MMSNDQNDKEGLKAVTLRRTAEFLWKANELAADDNELSRDILHSIKDSSEDHEYLNTICSKCGILRLPTNTMYRIKPKMKCSKTIQRAMKLRRQSNMKQSNKLAKRFVNSKSTLLVHCRSCQHIDRIPTANRTEIFDIKKRGEQQEFSKKTSSATPRTPQNTKGRGSVEAFLNTSKNKTPSSTPRRKKKKSHLSQLLAQEATAASSPNLMDFFKSFTP